MVRSEAELLPRPSSPRERFLGRVREVRHQLGRPVRAAVKTVKHLKLRRPTEERTAAAATATQALPERPPTPHPATRPAPTPHPAAPPATPRATTPRSAPPRRAAPHPTRPRPATFHAVAAPPPATPHSATPASTALVPARWESARNKPLPRLPSGESVSNRTSVTLPFIPASPFPPETLHSHRRVASAPSPLEVASLDDFLRPGSILFPVELAADEITLPRGPAAASSSSSSSAATTISIPAPIRIGNPSLLASLRTHSHAPGSPFPIVPRSLTPGTPRPRRASPPHPRPPRRTRTPGSVDVPGPPTRRSIQSAEAALAAAVAPGPLLLRRLARAGVAPPVPPRLAPATAVAAADRPLLLPLALAERVSDWNLRTVASLEAVARRFREPRERPARRLEGTERGERPRHSDRPAGRLALEDRPRHSDRPAHDGRSRHSDRTPLAARIRRRSRRGSRSPSAERHEPPRLEPRREREAPSRSSSARSALAAHAPERRSSDLSARSALSTGVARVAELLRPAPEFVMRAARAAVRRRARSAEGTQRRKAAREEGRPQSAEPRVTGATESQAF